MPTAPAPATANKLTFAFPGGEQVFNAARQAFQRSGYRRASVEAIAGEAGITVAKLVRHFPGKAALFVAVVEQTRRQQARGVRFAHVRTASLPQAEQLYAMLFSYLSNHRQDAALLEAQAEFCALSAEAERAALVEVNRRFCEGACEHFERLLKSACACWRTDDH